MKLVHMDLCGPSIIKSIYWTKYIMVLYQNYKDHHCKFHPKCDKTILLSYFTRGVAYMVLNRRTRLVEERCDVMFEELCVRNSSQTHFTSYIL